MTIAGHQVDDAMFFYIASNIDADTYKLLLKDEAGLSFDKSFAIQQIECRRRVRNKIPELIAHEHFIFGRAISAEQCTHEIVARFHASLFDTNDRVFDMTMGLGVDDYYISKHVKSLTSLEIDPIIAEAGKHNFGFLAPNIEVIQSDSADYLIQLGNEEVFDAIFIDPARRGESGNRLYNLADCQPNVLELLPLISQHASRLYIKASPMLDVTQSMRDLGESLTDVWAVSIKNECKELFFKLEFVKKNDTVTLHALNYNGKWEEFVTIPYPSSSLSGYAIPQQGDFLYEPNASIMKLGCYHALSQQTRTTPIAKNSHLYTNKELVTSFPGRKFVVKEIIPFKAKEIKRLTAQHKQFNIATRNFRLTANELKKRLRMQDGGDKYLFATTLANAEQVLILCEKAD